jgi:DNA polymerase III sliding clamp (beta) subunit (PCNA family)
MIYGTFVEAFGDFARQITFLSRAVGKDDTRYFMNHIHIEPSDTETGKLRGVATDGRRLHLVDPLSCPDGIGLAPGNWRPLKTDGKTAWIAQIKSDAGTFPNYREVIPKDEPSFTFDLPGLPRGNDLIGNMPYLVEFLRSFPEPTAINMNYLNSFDHYRAWTAKWYGSDKAVLFESGDYTVVIMPMRMKQSSGRVNK